MASGGFIAKRYMQAYEKRLPTMKRRTNILFYYRICIHCVTLSQSFSAQAFSSSEEALAAKRFPA